LLGESGTARGKEKVIIMSGREIVLALMGRWSGSHGMVRCPAHDDLHPSCSVTDSPDGKVLVRCFSGCSQEALIDALRRRGLWGQPRDIFAIDAADRERREVDERRELERRISKARAIWTKAKPITDTLAAGYLQSRSITITLPPTLRFAMLPHFASGAMLPAMIAAVQDQAGRVTAAHRTYLLSDGRGKAAIETPKMALGPIGAGAVRLRQARSVLAIAEGIETGLSIAQLYRLPVWVALGSRMGEIALPDIVRQVIVFGDNGAMGRVAAERAVERFTDQGRQAAAEFPPAAYGDFNDWHCAGAAA
jgi:putative DNA primase/helicase